MSKNIMLTGATGFLGSHLLRTLLKETDYNIVILKRSFSDISRIRNEIVNSRVKSINIDECPLCEAFCHMDGGGIDVIIHLATDYGWDADCVRVLESNFIYPIKLLELACKNCVKLFVNTDSYFNKGHVSYTYLQKYSQSKKTLNLWLKFFSKKIKVINMVLEHVYGNFDNPQKFVSAMIDKIAIKKVKFVDVTPGNQKRDFVFVDDVCKAYVKAIKYGLNNKFRYRKFEVGTGEAVSISFFLNKIKEISKSDTKINFGAIPYRDDEIMLSKADNIDLIGIGWKSKYTLEKGIKDTIKREIYFLHQKKILKLRK